MKLSPREIDKMMVSMAAIVARKRLDRGVKLNYPEAVSIISDYVVEGARDGKSVAELMESAAHVLKRNQLRTDLHKRIPKCRQKQLFQMEQS